ncbi:hypothetical protein D7V82_04920 [bacterium 1xD8-6]|nr:hypothetical protein D7V72_05600 [bacterium D16-36]RKI71912.1 hypothetical protein D7V82_04920 [bacterium 1xD8-6]
MNKYAKIAAGAVFVVVVVVFFACFSVYSVHSNAGAKEEVSTSLSNMNETDVASDEEDQVERETGLSIKNDEIEEYDGYIVRSREYQIDSEDDASKIKSYMKEEVKDGEAHSIR